MRSTGEIVELLALQPHPEGGHYREVYRSDLVVGGDGLLQGRSALTLIYFLLERGEHSAWHRVSSDEAWHFVEGDPLELLEVDPSTGACKVMRVGPLGDGQAPLQVVRGRRWQAARPLGAYALVTCSVAPGFDFDDLRILTDVDEDWPLVEQAHPEARMLLHPAPPLRYR